MHSTLSSLMSLPQTPFNKKENKFIDNNLSYIDMRGMFSLNYYYLWNDVIATVASTSSVTG